QLETLKVSIASREAFSRVGLPRPAKLSDFKFSVERSQAGKPVIIITSRDPVREPFMDFLLDATWPNGRLLKQYTILVDPPLTMPAAAPAPVAAVTPAPQPRAVVTPPPAPQPQPVTAPVAAPTTVTTAPSPAADTYGPVKRNETLWQVASRVRPGSDISMEQMMIALQRANPGAFINNNINNLRRGAVLDVPTREEILSMNSAEALSEARRQHEEWRDRRSQPAEAPEAATPTAQASAPEPVPEARLQLVAPEEPVVEGAAAPGEATEAAAGPETDQAVAAPADDLRQELALANEEVEARRAESSELQSRVSELESQLADMQRLLELKDEQLASIQAGMTDTDVEETGADVAAEMDEITVAEVKAAEQDTQAAEEETAVAEAIPVVDQPLGFVDRMMNNPLLTGLGVIVAMVLGGIIWAATRQRRSGDLFSDEPTMESQLAEDQGGVTLSDKAMLTSMAAGEAEMSDTDPAKEADIFLAYGRVQQAEDVLLEALENDPTNRELKLKLMEVYHAGGNSESFNTNAQSFRNLVNEDDPQWQKIALMGAEMMPDNPLYQAGGAAGASDAGVDFDMDLSGLDETRTEAADSGQSLDVDYQAGEENLAELPDSLE
ncbi:MAG: FimV/HubP family polar landmark protein, partial [Thiohalobacterales bacterium]|nr:FimV/HubP family polar landmark protein [Thiohalobacterales bacterium]